MVIAVQPTAPRFGGAVRDDERGLLDGVVARPRPRADEFAVVRIECQFARIVVRLARLLEVNVVPVDELLIDVGRKAVRPVGQDGHALVARVFTSRLYDGGQMKPVIVRSDAPDERHIALAQSRGAVARLQEDFKLLARLELEHLRQVGAQMMVAARKETHRGLHTRVGAGSECGVNAAVRRPAHADAVGVDLGARCEVRDAAHVRDRVAHEIRVGGRLRVEPAPRVERAQVQRNAQRRVALPREGERKVFARRRHTALRPHHGREILAALRVRENAERADRLALEIRLRRELDALDDDAVFHLAVEHLGVERIVGDRFEVEHRIIRRRERCSASEPAEQGEPCDQMTTNRALSVIDHDMQSRLTGRGRKPCANSLFKRAA